MKPFTAIALALALAACSDNDEHKTTKPIVVEIGTAGSFTLPAGTVKQGFVPAPSGGGAASFALGGGRHAAISFSPSSPLCDIRLALEWEGSATGGNVLSITHREWTQLPQGRAVYFEGFHTGGLSKGRVSSAYSFCANGALTVVGVLERKRRPDSKELARSIAASFVAGSWKAPPTTTHRLADGTGTVQIPAGFEFTEREMIDTLTAHYYKASNVGRIVLTVTEFPASEFVCTDALRDIETKLATDATDATIRSLTISGAPSLYVERPDVPDVGGTATYLVCGSATSLWQAQAIRFDLPLNDVARDLAKSMATSFVPTVPN